MWPVGLKFVSSRVDGVAGSASALVINRHVHPVFQLKEFENQNRQMCRSDLAESPDPSSPGANESFSCNVSHLSRFFTAESLAQTGALCMGTSV